MPNYTPAEAARILGKSERTIWRWMSAGRLHKVEIDGRVMVDVDDNDPLTRASDAVDRLSEVSAASAIESKTTRDTLAEIVTTLRQDNVRLAADARSGRRWQRLTVALLLVAVAGAAWLGAENRRLALSDVQSHHLAELNATAAARASQDASQRIRQADERAARAESERDRLAAVLTQRWTTTVDAAD